MRRPTRAFWATPIMVAATVMLIALSSSGCATQETGKPIDVDQTSQFVKGKTTKDDVKRIYGEPTSRTLDGNGQATWTYTHKKVHAELTGKGVAMAVVGLGHEATSDEQTETLTVTFNGNILKDFSYSESGQQETDKAGVTR